MGIPRDGKNTTLPEVNRALMTAFHLSPLAGDLFTANLPLLCRENGTLGLADTRRHNVIEHTHLDFRQGDGYTFRPDMLQAMIDDAEGGPVTRLPASQYQAL